MLTTAFIHGLSTTARGVQRLATHLSTVWRNRIALNQLSMLEDHILNDIGLKRGDLLNANTLPLLQDPYGLDPFSDRRRVTPAAIDSPVHPGLPASFDCCQKPTGRHSLKEFAT